jgi:SpoIIAA-like
MVELIPDLPKGVVGVRGTGRITSADYESVIIPAVEAALAQHGKARFLYHLGKDFSGFEAEALWDDMKVGLRHFNAWERIAVVSDVEWVRGVMKLVGLAMPGHVRVYRNDQFEEARAWVCE